MSDLKPCPFCTAALLWSYTYSEYHHPIAKCILSGHKFKKGMIGQWNRRALPAVQPDAREAARLLDDIACGRGMFGLDPAQDLQWAMETAAAALTLIDKTAAPHVNETPKSEHETRDVLTPATKGERDD